MEDLETLYQINLERAEKSERMAFGKLRKKKFRVLRLMKEVKSGVSDLSEKSKYVDDIKHINKELMRIRHSNVEARLKMLKSPAAQKNPQAAAIIMRNIGDDYENQRLLFDVYRCKCNKNRYYEFEVNMYKNVCPSCKITKKVINQPEDTSHDNSSIRNQRLPSSVANNHVNQELEKKELAKKAKLPKKSTAVIQEAGAAGAGGEGERIVKKQPAVRKRKSKEQIQQSYKSEEKEAGEEVGPVTKKARSSSSSESSSSQSSCRAKNGKRERQLPVTLFPPGVLSATNDRSPTYYRYLMQFVENRPEPPKRVMRVLYDEFNSIHLLNSLRCRSTSVKNVLHQYKLYEYESISVDITRKFNGAPVPQIPEYIIHICVERFREVTETASHLKNFGKLPSFEILTHLFLRAEGRDDIAIVLFYDKTSILKSAAHKINLLVEACQENPNCKHNWKHIPHTID